MRSTCAGRFKVGCRWARREHCSTGPTMPSGDGSASGRRAILIQGRRRSRVGTKLAPHDDGLGHTGRHAGHGTVRKNCRFPHCPALSHTERHGVMWISRPVPSTTRPPIRGARKKNERWTPCPAERRRRPARKGEYRSAKSRNNLTHAGASNAKTERWTPCPAERLGAFSHG
jgi:hypothetical protein